MNVPDTKARERAPVGLTRPQVEASRREHGYNEIPNEPDPAWKRLARRFWGPIPWMIEIAAVLSAAVQKWEDFAVICVLLFVNVFIDFRQEAKALSALEVLKGKLARNALVRREGHWASIPARELVPGDVVKVRLGDMVPADLRLTGPGFVQLDQSALTGESMPVSKTAGDDAYANAVVKMGEMLGTVRKTGLGTYFGKTVALVARAEQQERSHFQKAVIQVGNFLIVVALALVLLVLVVALFRHDPWLEILRFCLVLMVASVPVALPAVLSVTMAVGAVNLARHKAIVSRLVAIEELAGVDVLCSDKTGTLTKNEMALGDPVASDGHSPSDVIRFAALASREENADPLEEPLFAALDEAGMGDAVRSAARSHFLPFDPVGKRTEATVEFEGQRWVVTKGAPQVVAGLCSADTVPADFDQVVSRFAAKGNRTLAVARRAPDAEAFRMVGILPFFDPPRDDSVETIAKAVELGLSVKMITGDNEAIAREVARTLKIEGDIHRAPDLKEANHHGSKLIELISQAGGFAEVMPEDKYLIVDELQKSDHIVAMTGDGVNDAPALRKADAGIAVSGATDAARASADLVLTQAGLYVIIRAIEEARRIFGRMKGYAVFRIAETLRVVLFLALAIVVFDFYPVTAVMIIILALLNDIPIMAIAYDNAPVAPKPVRWNMKEVLVVAVVLGIAGVCSSFLLFFILEDMGLSQDLIQAIIFLKLDVAGHSTIYVTRSGPNHFWHRPYPSWKLLVPALGTRFLGTFIACYGLFMTAVGWEWVGWIYLYGTVWFVFNDYLKVATYKLLRRSV
ncbi:MAG: plasma-membrane proton-efflux P-type ATPase [Deltaproteobacteria bacterium]|nr:MAG: plasma-membrane proton-efflux P-type ATPase [Deltaproteobacteria bacterium]